MGSSWDVLKSHGGNVYAHNNALVSDSHDSLVSMASNNVIILRKLFSVISVTPGL